MFTKKEMKQVAIIAIIISIATMLTLLLFDINNNKKEAEKNVEISKRDFDKAKADALHQYDDVAAEILADAEIFYTIYPDEEKPFIRNINGCEFELYFMQPIFNNDNRFCRVIIDAGLLDDCSAEEFLQFFGKKDSFEPGYMTAKVMEYHILDNRVLPQLVVAPSILVSEDHYDIMANRPHVAFDGPLVEEIKKSIPFETTDGECYFVIDEATRLCGWFYFKSIFNDKEFTGCYEVDGWPHCNITYEEVVNLKNLFIEEVTESIVIIDVSGR